MSPMQAWERALVSTYADIARTRMVGLPLMHPGLHVQSVGMREYDEGWLAVLLTPWFMNLVWRAQEPDHMAALPAGQSRERRVGNAVFEFIGTWNEKIGPFEACSLISPMFQFVDQDAAEATAQMVLRELLHEPKASLKEAHVANQDMPGAAVDMAAASPATAIPGQGGPKEPVDQRRRSLFGFGGARR